MISRWSQIISSSWICSGYLVWCLEDPNGCPFCWWCPCPSWPCWQCYWAWPVRPGWLSTVTMCHWARKSDLDVFSFVLPKDFLVLWFLWFHPKMQKLRPEIVELVTDVPGLTPDFHFEVMDYALMVPRALGATTLWASSELERTHYMNMSVLDGDVQQGENLTSTSERFLGDDFLAVLPFFHWHDFVSTWCFASCFPRLTHHVELRRKNTSYPTLIQLFAGTISKVAAFSFMHWCRCFWIKVFSGIAVNCCCELAPKHVPRWEHIASQFLSFMFSFATQMQQFQSKIEKTAIVGSTFLKFNSHPLQFILAFSGNMFWYII